MDGDRKGDRSQGKRKPKVARTVNIPDDRPLSLEEFTDLKDHAYNSAFWNVTHFARTEKQVRDKLLSKGYVEGDVFHLDKDGGIKQFDILSWAIEELRERELLGDDDFTKRFVSSKLGQGWGMSRIRMELIRKGVDREIMDEALESEDFSQEQEDALDRELQRVIRSSAVTRENDSYKRSQKIVQSLMRKGFSYGDIRERMEEIDLEND